MNQDELERVARILESLLRAWRNVNRDEINLGQIETVVVGQDLLNALEWLDRFYEARQSGSSGNMPREVGSMDIVLYQVGDRVEMRYQNAVLGHLRMNKELISQMEVNSG